MENFDKYKGLKLIRKSFEPIIKAIEILVAVLSLAFVILAALYMIKELPTFWLDLHTNGLQKAMEGYLADILLIVVGVELILMLILHTPESLLDVMCFVIAREMLVRSNEFNELLVGVVALALLFAIRKYLLYNTPPQTDSVKE